MVGCHQLVEECVCVCVRVPPEVFQRVLLNQAGMVDSL